MQITLERRKKVTLDFLRSVLKRKNRVEGGTSCSRVKKEHDSTNLKAQKMMRGVLEPFVVQIVVRTMQPMVHAIKQIAEVPQMTSPHERQPREQKQEIPQMTSPQEKQLQEQNQGGIGQGFQRVKNIYTLKGMYVKIGWRLLPVQNIFNIYNNICSNNNKHKKVYRLLNYKWKEWRHNLFLKSLDQHNYRYHLISQNLQKDSHLNLNQGD